MRVSILFSLTVLLNPYKEYLIELTASTSKGHSPTNSLPLIMALTPRNIGLLISHSLFTCDKFLHQDHRNDIAPLVSLLIMIAVALTLNCQQKIITKLLYKTYRLLKEVLEELSLPVNTQQISICE